MQGCCHGFSFERAMSWDWFVMINLHNIKEKRLTSQYHSKIITKPLSLTYTMQCTPPCFIMFIEKDSQFIENGENHSDNEIGKSHKNYQQQQQVSISYIVRSYG